MKITANQLKSIIKEELANMAGSGESSPHGSGYEMVEEKQEPTLSDQINEVIIDVLRKEGGAAGYDPIKDAVVKSAGMEKTQKVGFPFRNADSKQFSDGCECSHF